jgi:hypothetical protein
MVQGPVSKITTAKWTQGVAQEIENLLCKHQVLSSNSSHKKKKKKRLSTSTENSLCIGAYQGFPPPKQL